MKIHDCKDDDKVGAGADETQQTHAAGVGEIHWHGDVDPLESRPQLINKVLPEVGCGLISGQWGTYKTFVAIGRRLREMLGMLGAAARRGLRRATMLIRHRSDRAANVQTRATAGKRCG
jgi:hypothetical protein